MHLDDARTAEVGDMSADRQRFQGTQRGGWLEGGKRYWSAATRNGLGTFLLALTVLSSCGLPLANSEQAVLGRWKRTAEGFVGDPLQSLGGGYVEFREQGVLATLLYDEAGGAFWLVAEGRYSLPGEGQLNIEGRCWRGWESYACADDYRFTLEGDRLTIYGGEGGATPLEYQRAGDASPEMAPTLAPPFPSPTP